MRISEIYASLQGEGRYAGTPSGFVRTSGCNLRCVWCDTPFTSWEPEGAERSVDEVLAAVTALGPRQAVITGGEPLLLPDVPDLCRRLRAAGWHVTIETAGSLLPAADPAAIADFLSISPKLASSTPPAATAGAWAARHEAARRRDDVLVALMRAPHQLKFVIGGPADLDEACGWLDDLARAQRLTRFLILGGSLLLLGMMGLFGLRLYSTLQRQLNANQLQNAFMAKVDQVWPSLSQKFMDSAMKAAPAYGEQAMQRFEKVRPQLETMLTQEAGQFAERLQASMMQKTEAGMQRVGDRIAKDLKRQIPTLTEKKLDSIEERLRNSLLVEGGGIADELQTKVDKERDRVEKLLARLPVDEVAKQPEEKLQRLFIHHVLMMIDQSVAADEGPIVKVQ